MTGTDNGEIYFSEQHKKRAYFAMCRATVLLFVFTFLSGVVSNLVSVLLSEYSFPVQKLLVKLCMLFGAEKQTSISVVKSFMGSAVFLEAVRMFMSLLTMVVPAVIFARSTKMTGNECFCTKGRIVKMLPVIFCVCQLLTLTALVLSQSVYGFLVPDGAGISSSGALAGGGIDTFGLVMRIINVCIFVPVTEEFVFRGVLFSYLKRYGLSFAVVASAVLFGVAHSSPVQSVYAFVFGLFAAFLSAVTGNIKTGIILHALNNFITVMTEYLQFKTDGTVFNAVYAVFMGIVLAVSFYGVYRILVTDNMLGVFRERAKENDEGIPELPGFAQIMTVPMIIYGVNYALSIAAGVLVK